MFTLGLEGDQILPNADDFCASFQYCIIKHIVRRLQRGMEFVRMNSILPDTNRALVGPYANTRSKGKNFSSVD